MICTETWQGRNVSSTINRDKKMAKMILRCSRFQTLERGGQARVYGKINIVVNGKTGE